MKFKRFGPTLCIMIIIFIVLCSYTTTERVVGDRTAVKNSKNVYSVNITYEQSLGQQVLMEVQAALQKLPPKVTKSFVDNHWKIVVVSTIDLKGTEFEGLNEPFITSGLTNYEAKTIQVAPLKNSPDNFVMIKALHELCHYADEYYDFASQKEDFLALYNKYKDSYVEFEFSSIAKTDENKIDIEYAGTDEREFFACSMKDFLNNSDYLKNNYSELYLYYSNLIKK